MSRKELEQCLTHAEGNVNVNYYYFRIINSEFHENSKKLFSWLKELGYHRKEVILSEL